MFKWRGKKENVVEVVGEEDLPIDSEMEEPEPEVEERPDDEEIDSPPLPPEVGADVSESDGSDSRQLEVSPATSLGGNGHNKSATVADLFLDFGDEQSLVKRFGKDGHADGLEAAKCVNVTAVAVLRAGGLFTRRFKKLGGQGKDSGFNSWCKTYVPDLSRRTIDRWRSVYLAFRSDFEKNPELFANVSLSALYRVVEFGENSVCEKLIELAQEKQRVTCSDIRPFFPEKKKPASKPKNKKTAVIAATPDPPTDEALDIIEEGLESEDTSGDEVEAGPESTESPSSDSQPQWLTILKTPEGYGEDEASFDCDTEDAELAAQEVELEAEPVCIDTPAESPSESGDSQPQWRTMPEPYGEREVGSLHLFCVSSNDLADAIHELETRGFPYHSMHIALVDAGGDKSVRFLVNGGGCPPQVTGLDAWFTVDESMVELGESVESVMRYRIADPWPENSTFEVFSRKESANPNNIA